MKKICMIFAVFLTFSHIHAWEVVENECDNGKKWEVIFDDSLEDDRAMLGHINDFLDYLDEHSRFFNLQRENVRAMLYGASFEFSSERVAGQKGFWEKISKLTFLKRLEIHYFVIGDLPACIGDLVHLEEINFLHTKLTALPETLGQLQFLRRLNLEENKLPILPAAITGLENLETLILSKNFIRELPEDFGALKALKILDLSENNITSLPASFCDLESLAEFFMTGHRGSVPPRLNFRDHQRHHQEGVPLTSLMAYYSLESLPENFGNLGNLRVLHLQNSNLKRLPDSFGNLGNLCVLQLQKNILEELPPGFGNLSNLHTLKLQKNKLEELPADFGNLSNLHVLHLKNNALKTVPESFGNLKKMYDCDLRNNPLIMLPFSLVQLVEHMGPDFIRS